jgi:hypothetical protein
LNSWVIHQDCWVLFCLDVRVTWSGSELPKAFFGNLNLLFCTFQSWIIIKVVGLNNTFSVFIEILLLGVMIMDLIRGIYFWIVLWFGCSVTALPWIQFILLALSITHTEWSRL